MIHILLCPHTLDFGGSQLGVYHWAKYLDKSKFKVTILAMGRGGLSEKFEANYPVYYDDIEYPNITKYIKELKPDILHACPGGGKHQEYITKASSLLPVTQTVMCPRVVSNYKEVIASVVISKYVYFLQPQKENIIQIDLPFDITDYDIKYGKGYFDLPEDKIVIGSFGNNRRENEHFLKIARYYKNENVHFVIKTAQKYRYLIGKKRITTLDRHLTEDEKMSLMSCFDIFLYPTSNEAYGIVFLEAMSQKVPIISYDDSAMPEVIGKGGLIAPLNNIDKMMEYLDELVINPQKRRAVGIAGYELYMKRNNPRLIAKKYEVFFKNTVKASSSDET